MSVLEQLSRTCLLCRDYVFPSLSDAEICSALQSFKVCIRSDSENLSSHSGQTALVTLVLLLGRMGMQVFLDVPEVESLHEQPPLSGRLLRQSLIDVSEALISGTKIESVRNTVNADVVFVLGDSLQKYGKAPEWTLTGDDFCGSIHQAPSFFRLPSRWTSPVPIGGMVAATLAANEAFKLVILRLPFRNDGDKVFFEPSLSCSWDFGSLALPNAVLDLGNVDVISAGAISQAALYALLRLPNIRMCGRIFDDDVTFPSNLNRNMLTFLSDVGKLKVTIAVERCSSKVLLSPVPKRFSGNGLVGQGLSNRILVGVDDIPSRWGIQQAASGWLAVSGTTHFNVSSSAHRTDEPCAGCLHPVDDPDTEEIPTVSFVSFWAGLSMAVRLLREAAGAGYGIEKQHLWLTPLRMDQPHAAMWLPVAPITQCPVRCSASQR